MIELLGRKEGTEEWRVFVFRARDEAEALALARKQHPMWEWTLSR